jgi:hypothetical protein
MISAPNQLSDYSNDYARVSSQYLSRPGGDILLDQNIATFAGAFKRVGATGVIMGLFQKFSPTTARDSFRVQLDASDRFMFLGRSSVELAQRTTNLSFPPAIPTTWQNWVVWWDWQNSIANDRIRVWINGTEVTSFATVVNPTAAMQKVDSAPWEIGRSGNASNTWDGLIGHTMYFGGELVPQTDIFNGAGPPMEGVRTRPSLRCWQTSQNILTGSDAAASAVYDEIAGNWTNNNTVTTITDNPVTNI